MTRTGDEPLTRAGLTRRMALAAPLMAAGCDTIEGWFSTKKDPLPGRRESLGALGRGFAVDETAPRVALNPAIQVSAWTQYGGGPTHETHNFALSATPVEAWSTDLGDGGGYRRQITAHPIVANGMVFAMDSSATVSGLDFTSGSRIWRYDTVPSDSESSNVGGGLCWDSGTLYAVNGVGDILALDAATGRETWRKALHVPARSPLTVVDGRIFFVTLDSKLTAVSASDGHILWTWQATAAPTTLLGAPAPAVANGIVVAGFSSGEVVAARVESGAVVWTDGLGLTNGRASLSEFMAIRGAPVILNNLVYITGMGGLTVAADLLTGRRVWERRVSSANGLYAAGNSLFLISADQEAGAINIDDARIAWVTPLAKWEKPEKRKNPITWFGPIVAGGRVIILSDTKQLLSLNPMTGEIMTTQDLPAVPAAFPPIVVNGTMLLVTNNGHLSAWR